MAKKKHYTQEQIERFLMNPYTHSATPSRVSFTLEFKEFFMSQIDIPGMTTAKILQAAGYDPHDFTSSSLDRMRSNIKRQAASPEGLHPPRGLSTLEKNRAFAKKNLSLQKQEQSIAELQEHIVYLEEQIEFLKKISFLAKKKDK